MATITGNKYLWNLNRPTLRIRLSSREEGHLSKIVTNSTEHSFLVQIGLWSFNIFQSKSFRTRKLQKVKSCTLIFKFETSHKRRRRSFVKIVTNLMKHSFLVQIRLWSFNIFQSKSYKTIKLQKKVKLHWLYIDTSSRFITSYIHLGHWQIKFLL